MTDENMLSYIEQQLLDFFQGDKKKVDYWLSAKNLNFGGMSPQDLIRRGKIVKVYEFVKDARENER